MNSSSSNDMPPLAWAVGLGVSAYLFHRFGMDVPAIVLAVLAVIFLIGQFLTDIPGSAPDSAEASPPESAAASAPNPPDPAPTPPADSPVSAASLLPESIRGHEIAYRYEDVGIFVPKDATFDVDGFVPGAVLTLFHDVENENDPNAVGLRLNKRLVGYLYRGKLQDMANNWIEKKLPLRAVLTKLFRDDRRAEVLLAFYDLSDFKKLRLLYPDAKEYRLAYNSNADMQDNLLLCSKCDECSLVYDCDKDRYLVSSGFDIGYLPASAGKLVERFGEESCRVFIADLYTNDSDKTVATVYVFPTK